MKSWMSQLNDYDNAYGDYDLSGEGHTGHVGMSYKFI